VLIWGFALCLVGVVLLRIAIREGHRAALFTGAFWITFPQFARYRLKRVWPALLGLTAGILLIWGLVLLFQWLLAYYGARLGHPLGSG
jgi:hypothetical protein